VIQVYACGALDPTFKRHQGTLGNPADSDQGELPERRHNPGLQHTPAVEVDASRKTMKLLLNLSTLGPNPTGLGVYAKRCADAACDAFESSVIASGAYPVRGQSVIPSPADIALGASRFAGVKRWLWSRNFRPPAGHLPYSPTHQGLAHGNGQILTIHDLTSIRLPKTHPIQNLYFRFVIPGQVARARAVFTVSETTKIDIHETYGVPLDSIFVVPNGVDTDVFNPGDVASRQEFLLVVGASYFHKNTHELIQRAALWKDRYTLTIVSARGKYGEFLRQTVARSGLTDRVTFIPYAEQADLVKLYRTCAAFIYPSKWEGFGIPPLEALACGAPVIASDIPVHREILGSAAKLVTLGCADSWSEAIAHIDSLKCRASNHLAEPVRRFTWESSARLLVAALLKVEPKLEVRYRG
jgi:glycosyltransferase involved in cell wall biosynthesis